MSANRQHVEQLIGQLTPDRFEAIAHLLEVMLDPVARSIVNAPIEDEEISEDEEQGVARSKQWFKHHDGIAFEQVVADLGFTMDQIRNHRLEDERDPAA
jgi:hypothetical protein